ncbi:uncharacterized protein LOC128667617 [Microplitis demolitor]|uniref:uncharacterized protein LOC128667617 n=1 Tax=Microplitis demolitor TaxID=69319 RepID=UPI00235B6127|nr:uncharacterized protein LOC128667617 [Microplitis demolitor]
MNFLIMFILIIFSTITNARFVYLNKPKNNYDNRGHSDYSEENYFNNNEQSSRDLDLSFSLDGDDEIEKTVSPLSKKVYLIEYPEITRELENPAVYYKLTEVPMPLLSSSSKKIINEPAMFPLQYQRNHKLIKLNNSQKGEIVLELRIIVNNNNNAS